MTEGGVHSLLQGRDQQRVSAEIEEVLVDAGSGHAKQLRPDRGETLLGHRHGLECTCISGEACGRRKRGAIGLAVCSEWQGVHRNDVRRDHEVGEIALQKLAEACGVGCMRLSIGQRMRSNRPLPDNDIDAKAHAAGRIGPDARGGGFDLWMAKDSVFDGLKLDAEAAHLDLVIRAAEALDSAVRAPDGEVAGSVEACAAGRGNLDEALGGEPRLPAVAVSNANAAEVEIALHADREEVAPGVKQVRGRVGDGSADGDRPTAAGNARNGRPDGGFGRAVHVPEVGAGGEQTVGKIARQRLAAAEHAQRRAGSGGGLCRPAPADGKQGAPCGWRGLHDGAAGAFNERGEQIGILRGLAAGDHHAAAG